jgi:hypothetical protein
MTSRFPRMVGEVGVSSSASTPPVRGGTWHGGGSGRRIRPVVAATPSPIDASAADRGRRDGGRRPFLAAEDRPWHR